MAACPGDSENALGGEGGTRQRVARISAPAVRPRALGEPERVVGLRHHAQDRGRSGEVRRADSGSVRSGVVAVGRGQDPHPGEPPMGAPPLPGARFLEGGARSVALRRGGLRVRDLGERGPGRGAQGRLRFLQPRRHRLPEGRRERTASWRARPHGRRRTTPRQTGAGATWYLVHGRLRHLADRVDGTGTRQPAPGRTAPHARRRSQRRARRWPRPPCA